MDPVGGQPFGHIALHCQNCVSISVKKARVSCAMCKLHGKIGQLNFSISCYFTVFSQQKSIRNSNIRTGSPLMHFYFTV